jgi:hypothetical protein
VPDIAPSPFAGDSSASAGTGCRGVEASQQVPVALPKCRARLFDAGLTSVATVYEILCTKTESGMRRFQIFAALGPFLSWFICIAFAFALTYPGPIFEDGRYWPASFMVCYAFALLPLLATAYIDRKLSHYRWRVLVCGLAGFGMATALYYILTHEGGSEQDFQKFRQYWFFVGLVWGLPAAACSWLSGQKQNRSAM